MQIQPLRVAPWAASAGALLSWYLRDSPRAPARGLPLRWALATCQHHSPTALCRSVLLPERSAFGGLSTLS